MSIINCPTTLHQFYFSRYTTQSKEALHYVQFDQGEDRWLCTLLLQAGYRVEYNAASDAYTHCPEGFGEFYTQRRRWAPSTIANILDLLSDYRRVVKVNPNISYPYMLYQLIVMVGTILGPGTILLMVVGATNAVFGIDNNKALLANLIPVVIFIFACFVSSNEIQIALASILTVIYVFIMLAVLVGTVLQAIDQPLSPSTIFFVVMLSTFVLSASFHPREASCAMHFLLYILMIPSMYMLLTLYSLINLNIVSWGTRESPKPHTDNTGHSSKTARLDFSLGEWFRCMICPGSADRVNQGQSNELDQETNQHKGISDARKYLQADLGILVSCLRLFCSFFIQDLISLSIPQKMDDQVGCLVFQIFRWQFSPPGSANSGKN